MLLKRGMSIGAAVMIATFFATPARADSARAGVVEAPQVTSQVAALAAADACGNHTHVSGDVVWRFWGNCTSSGQRINVDTILWPDRRVCVAAGGEATLGPTDSVRGASLVGSC